MEDTYRLTPQAKHLVELGRKRGIKEVVGFVERERLLYQRTGILAKWEAKKEEWLG
jgi:hypothetical protein